VQRLLLRVAPTLGVETLVTLVLEETRAFRQESNENFKCLAQTIGTLEQTSHLL
jgi:hypothetical protein